MQAGWYDPLDESATMSPGSQLASDRWVTLDARSEERFPVHRYEDTVMLIADEVWCRRMLGVIDVRVDSASLTTCISWVGESPFRDGGNNVMLPETWAVRVARPAFWLPEAEYRG